MKNRAVKYDPDLTGPHVNENFHVARQNYMPECPEQKKLIKLLEVREREMLT